jgi:putative two-component system response regulator
MHSPDTSQFPFNLTETTRIDIDKIRSAAEGSGDDATQHILMSLYQNQKSKAKQLEEQVALSNLQAMKYASDLTKVSQQIQNNEHELAEANGQLRKYAIDLRTTITTLKAVNKDLEAAYYDTIRRLVIASEYKDRNTGNHITRISRYSALIAEKLGMPPDEVHSILYASPMHDVGKIGIPDKILLKNGKLLDAELEIMKLHTLIGSNILADSKARVLQLAQQIALYHHEKWNGTGYPNAVSKHEIPLPARIVALVDTFDALMSKRPYKEAYSVDASCDIIRRERELHFDPEIVDVFFLNLDAILKIREEITEKPDIEQPNQIHDPANPEQENLAQLYR